MILKTKEFKNNCAIILSAIDNSEVSNLNENLELKTEGRILLLNVTNKEYFATVKFDLEHEEDFHATVNANLFLKLIAAITTDEIELTIRENYMAVKANGNYKLPLIFDNNEMLTLPPITILNKTLDMNISGEILNSILQYNSKELVKTSIAKPIQKLYYLDQEGCITFTTGACVNNFVLEKPVKILLNNRLVKLFKLFKNSLVKFTLGYDAISESIVQTKVLFETPTITLTAILPSDDSLLAQVPVEKIRALANTVFNHTAVINTEELLQAVNRLILFNEKNVTFPLGDFKCNSDEICISNRGSMEFINTGNGSNVEEEYSMTINLDSLKTILDTCVEQHVTINFGNNQAIVICRGQIKNVIPEITRRVI